jgi:hypothetical protein
MADENTSNLSPSRQTRRDAAAKLERLIMTRCTLRCLLRGAALSALALSCLLFAPGTARAQGDGPRAWLLAPSGLNAVSFTWMELSSTYNFAGDILIPNADIDSDVEALAYIRYFDLGGRFAQLQATGIFGGVGGTVAVPPGSGFPLPPGTYDTRRFRGFGDPIVTFRLGIAGAPALKLPEFVTYKQGPQLYGFLAVAPPLGEYESTQLVNLGTNRWTTRAGAAVVVPLRTGPTPTYLEIVPSVSVFSRNDDVSGAAVERTQAPLFLTEAHLTHNLTPKFWIGGGLRYQYGGETTTDGISDGNRSNALGGGVGAGYQIVRPLSALVTWGQVIAEDDGSRGTMWRVRLALAF